MLLIMVYLFAGIISIWIGIRLGFVVVNVEGNSMLPTLKSGDQVLVLRCWSPNWVRKNQIIVVKPWTTNPVAILDTNTRFVIKRVAGLPDDIIILDTKYLKMNVKFPHFEKGNKHVVPVKHFFVLGDYEKGCVDSTYLGPVPFQNLVGVVIKKL